MSELIELKTLANETRLSCFWKRAGLNLFTQSSKRLDD